MAKFISFDRLCGGAALERFSLAMKQVAQNIMDPNTDPEKSRNIKDWLATMLESVDEEIQNRITIIG